MAPYFLSAIFLFSLDRFLRSFFNYYSENNYSFLNDLIGFHLATNEFIAEDPRQPFFAILAFNAVHTPMQSREEDLAQFTSLKGNLGGFLQQKV